MGCGSKPKREEASPYERKLAAIARKDRSYWRKTFRPEEDKAIDVAHRAGSDQERTRLRGKAHLTVMSGMRAPTGNPNAPSVVRAVGGQGIDMGKTSARAGTNADLVASTDKQNQLTNLAFYGRGMRGIADANLKSVAGYKAGHNALETQSANDASRMNMELASEAIGMGIGYSADKGWFDKDSDVKSLGMNTTHFDNGYDPRLVKSGNALA